MVWPWFFCVTVFVCPQSPYRSTGMIFWIFPVVLCHMFCLWHWPICEKLDLSFIWGHHHLHYSLHHADETHWTRLKQLSMISILGVQFRLLIMLLSQYRFAFYVVVAFPGSWSVGTIGKQHGMGRQAGSGREITLSFSTRPGSSPCPALLPDCPHWRRAWNRLMLSSSLASLFSCNGVLPGLYSRFTQIITKHS